MVARSILGNWKYRAGCIYLQLVLAACAFGQADILISQHTPYIDFARAVNGGTSFQWGVSGNGGVNNNFLFAPFSPEVGTCMWMVNNNPTNGHSFNLDAAQTADSSQVTFIGATQKWSAFGPRIYTLAVGGVATIAQNIGANGVNIYYIPSRGAARIALQISASVVVAGSPDTVSIFASFTDRTACASLVNGPGDALAASDISLGFIRVLNAAQGQGSAAGTFGLLHAPLDAATALNLSTQPVNSGSGAANNGPALVEKGPRWNVSMTSNGTISVATKAAGGAGVRHIVDCVSFSAGANGATVAIAAEVGICDVDCNTNVLWRWSTTMPPGTAGQVLTAPHSICGLALVGGFNSAMVLEFTASAVNIIEDVSMSGFDVQ